MKRTFGDKIEEARINGPRGTRSGAFGFKISNAHIRVITSDGMGWDHVSVSLATRTPSWEEMCRIKDLFFGPEEVVMQLHPAKSEYVNHHPFCLHLWRPQTPSEMLALAKEWGEEWDTSWQTPGRIPLPPSICVGPKPIIGPGTSREIATEKSVSA